MRKILWIPWFNANAAFFCYYWMSKRNINTKEEWNVEWNGIHGSGSLHLCSQVEQLLSGLGPGVNAKEQRPDSPIFLVSHPHNWTECKFSYFVPTAQRFSGVTLKSGSFHVKDIEELDKVQIYNQMYNILFRSYNKKLTD